jgi:hypothetical protein
MVLLVGEGMVGVCLGTSGNCPRIRLVSSSSKAESLSEPDRPEYGVNADVVIGPLPLEIGSVIIGGGAGTDLVIGGRLAGATDGGGSLKINSAFVGLAGGLVVNGFCGLAGLGGGGFINVCSAGLRGEEAVKGPSGDRSLY